MMCAEALRHEYLHGLSEQHVAVVTKFDRIKYQPRCVVNIQAVC